MTKRRKKWDIPGEKLRGVAGREVGAGKHTWTDARTDRRLLETVGAQGRREFNRIDNMIDSSETQRM